jgi:glycosyltransferase involved in cell wall biosynthesis
VHRDINEIREKLINKYDLKAKRIVIYTGHLNIASDLGAIFRIIKIAGERCPDIRLLVAGGGPRERHFRKLAGVFGVEEITIFTGHLSPEDVVSHLLISEVGIVYYKEIEVNLYRESMKLRDMLSTKLKIVCNDFGDLKHFSSFTYQTSSSYKDVAFEVVRVLENGGDGREMGGAEFVRDQLDWRKIGKNLFDKLSSMRNTKTERGF